MIDKRLFEIAPKSKRMVLRVVLYNWLSLIANIIILMLIGWTVNHGIYAPVICIQFILLLIKIVMTGQARRMSVKTSNYAKFEIRNVLYQKMIDLGVGVRDTLNSATLTQLMGDGVDQLEIYFGSYMPQLFYAVLAPLTLFIFLARINSKVSIILLILVPIIPISIIVVQKIAKRILSRYWDSYIVLGNTFLNNIQGLTTLKLFRSDGLMHEKMNRESESFRKATMRLLVMQLNSISVMDLVAYGGSALAIFLTYKEYGVGALSLGEAIVFILISSEFFIPMRLLGSFFHVAMNGLSAADRIFKFLDTEIKKKMSIAEGVPFRVLKSENLSFDYGDKRVLNSVSFEVECGSFIGIVGESGSGKSTLLKILSKNIASSGIYIDDFALEILEERYYRDHVVLVSSESTVFSGTIRTNLEMSGVKDESDLNKMVQVLKLKDLDYPVMERGSNLSGGEKQRLLVGRALLSEADIYLFDEITSNVDVESEKLIMKVIKRMTDKLVIVVSHRLENVIDADEIIVLDQGTLVGKGKHDDLLESCDVYKKLYVTQKKLEGVIGGA